jgi:hypothetical protein
MFLGIRGGEIDSWLYTFSKIVSIVSMTGMFVNKLSTSKDAIIGAWVTDLIMLINSCVDSTMNCFGRYFYNNSLSVLATVYEGDPMLDIIGRIGGSVTFLCSFGVPYI